MSGYARFSASLGLTLAIWLPNTVGSLLGDGVDVQSAVIRFLVVFVFARIAMRGLDVLLRAYTFHNEQQRLTAEAKVARDNGQSIDFDGVSVLTTRGNDLGRRRTDGRDGNDGNAGNAGGDDIDVYTTTDLERVVRP